MDPQMVRRFVLPGVGAALLIVGVGLAVGLANRPEEEPRKLENLVPQDQPQEPLLGPNTDRSATGLADAMVPLDGMNWQPHEGGLKILDVVEGTGEPVRPGAMVAVHYTGWLASNGVEFDSSVRRGEPSEFSLNGVIAGWSNGIPGMKVGGIRRLFIPWHMAYGEQGSGRNIPPRADLVFEVKLLAFR